jgi:hypothetical protein
MSILSTPPTNGRSMPLMLDLAADRRHHLVHTSGRRHCRPYVRFQLHNLSPESTELTTVERPMS